MSASPPKSMRNLVGLIMRSSFRYIADIVL